MLSSACIYNVMRYFTFFPKYLIIKLNLAVEMHTSALWKAMLRFDLQLSFNCCISSVALREILISLHH